MTEVEVFIGYVFIGIGATLFMDIWGATFRFLWNIQQLDYALVGRWIGHMFKGKWFHNPIFTASPIPFERGAGWFAHYAIGIIFALVFGLLAGANWISFPTIISSVIFGVMTVLFPFFIMQPAFGAGIAASKTPNPNIARLKSLNTHFSFGLGLYLAANILAYFQRAI